MGAGKTTFIHALCDYLNVKDTVSSPTFALINEYHFNNSEGQDQLIFHMDLYRIGSHEEAAQAGIEDALMNKNAYCFVEWAEKATGLMPLPYLDIYIETVDDTMRTITFKAISG